MHTEPYREEEDSIFLHKNTAYTLNKIFEVTAQQLPVPMPIEAIGLEAMGVNRQQMKEGRFTCQSCQSDQKRHLERVLAVDYSSPIVVLNENGSLYVVDGMHRIESALRNNIQVVLTRTITSGELQVCEHNL